MPRWRLPRRHRRDYGSSNQTAKPEAEMRARDETVVKAKEQLNEQVAEKVSWSEADRRGRIEEGQTRPTTIMIT